MQTSTNESDSHLTGIILLSKVHNISSTMHFINSFRQNKPFFFVMSCVCSIIHPLLFLLNPHTWIMSDISGAIFLFRLEPVSRRHTNPKAVSRLSTIERNLAGWTGLCGRSEVNTSSAEVGITRTGSCMKELIMYVTMAVCQRDRC